MADFLTNLWTSIFTPGPTPTLLIATNASFGCLQLVFLALLAATHSVHFVALSFISAGLWWAINWFARELAEARAKEEQARRIRERKEKDRGAGGEAPQEVGADEGMDSGDDTETETEGRSKVLEREGEGMMGAEATPEATTTGAAPVEEKVVARRKGSVQGTESSTDSEWEKVEGER